MDIMILLMTRTLVNYVCFMVLSVWKSERKTPSTEQDTHTTQRFFYLELNVGKFMYLVLIFTFIVLPVPESLSCTSGI